VGLAVWLCVIWGESKKEIWYKKESTRKTKEKLDGRYKEGHERKKPK
jgi:hypothetical protein